MAAVPRFLGLQPVTPNLKPIVPYLQRAEELRTKDPIMTYWCAYYAAQVGIALKAKDNASRAMLFELLTLLEKMKEEIGANDAIDLEAASSAYVENFALKVFTMADNEDRRGHATRSTAKKFLAAANFLEILKTFKPEYVDYHEDKIRYAKWKASDIAKAIREGRKPTPGPAGGEEEDFGMPEAPTDTAPAADASAESTPQSAHHTPQSAPSTAPTSPDLSNSTQPPAKRSPPPPKIDLQDEHYRKPPKDHLSGLRKWGGESEPTPGSWSTAATPGLTSPGHPDDERGLLDAGILKHVPSGDGGAKAVHFAPSEPSVPPQPPRASSPPRGAHGQPSPNGPGTLHTLGSASSGAQVPLGYVQDSAPGPSSLPSHQASAVPPPQHTVIAPHTGVAPSAPSPLATSNLRTASVAATNGTETVELTPQIIAKTQKHCRFAISALDYEDAEQAKKELRAALAILGG
ncbi:DUF605-domain-containing protein [Schizophyllum commune H4-8]|nr:DUF605-domain-containing protein [Schizophyllum commune H4-8]KAI5898025.1 DUF605-domain-containing protein [Schizophyllum commune H4-8]